MHNGPIGVHSEEAGPSIPHFVLTFKVHITLITCKHKHLDVWLTVWTFDFKGEDLQGVKCVFLTSTRPPNLDATKMQLKVV